MGAFVRGFAVRNYGPCTGFSLQQLKCRRHVVLLCNVIKVQGIRVNTFPWNSRTWHAWLICLIRLKRANSDKNGCRGNLLMQPSWKSIGYNLCGKSIRYSLPVSTVWRQTSHQCAVMFHKTRLVRVCTLKLD